MSSVVTQKDLIQGFAKLGIQSGMALEVHSSLSSFGYVIGGAMTVVKALKQAVGKEGALIMPSFRLASALKLNEDDKKLGLTLKVRILKANEPRSGMGMIADTFRQSADVLTGEGIFRVSSFGKDADIHVHGFSHLIDTDGYALLLGVGIYKLSSMHYVEDNLPEEIANFFKVSKQARQVYPENQWFIEAGHPLAMAWYKIQNEAYDKGLIREEKIGDCLCQFFKVKDVIALYQRALETDPLGLYGFTNYEEKSLCRI